MPQVIGIRCVESGYLPAKVGRFSLSPSGLDTVPLRRGMPRESILSNGQRARLPNTDIIYQMSGNPSPKTKAIPGAVMISSNQLPEDLLNPFKIAGKPFLEDVTEFSDSLVFLPFLTRDQQWCEGFVGEGPELLRALDCDDPGRMMLVNLYKAEGGRFEAERFYRTVSPLLGRMKLTQLLRRMGTPEASLNLVEYYMNHYHGSLISRIMHELSAGYQEYVNSELHQFHQAELARRNQIAQDAYLGLGPNEVGLLTALE